MRKAIPLLLAVLLVVPALALAAEEKTRITFGLKTWLNDWNVRQSDPGGKMRFGKKSTTVASVGPVVNVRKGRYFVGGSVLKNLSEYERERSTTPLSTAKLRKWDYDVAGGYYFHPNVAVFGGYKFSKWFFDSYYASTGQSYFSSTFKQYGPLLGATANYPIGSTGITPFATYSYYFLRRAKTTTTEKYNETGPSLEAGVAYGFRSFTATVGYKYQNFYLSEAEGLEARYKGFMFSLNYTL